MFGDFVGCCGNFAATRGFEVIRHLSVVAEHRTSGTDFGAHVANSCFACCRNCVGAFAEVFDYGTCATFDGENSRDFENHIFGA